MSTKERLALAWDKLNALCPRLDQMTHHELNLAIVEIEQDLAEGRRLIVIGGHRPVYAIGIEIEPGEFGMMHGPTPDLKEMLSVVPFGDDAGKYVILRYEEGQGDLKSYVSYHWSLDQKAWEHDSD